MSDSASNNSRITNRMIYDRQEKLIEMYHEVNTEVEVHKERLKTHRDDIDALKKKSNVIDGIIGGVAVIGSIFGITTK